MYNNSIIFFSHTITHRLIYVTELVFQDLLGLTIVFTQNEEDYRNSELPKIIYKELPLSILEEKNLKQVFFIQNQAILFENQISRKHLDIDFSYFLHSSPFDFDVLATIFLLVTRYEEYVADPSLLDNHNRFSAKISIAKKFNFLQKPIVNQWVMEINKRLQELFPELKMTLPSYRFQPTFDIDMPWKYKNKGFFRTVGGFAKDLLNLNVVELKNRANILRGVKDDPYFTFDYIFEEHKRHNHQPIFFLLLGDYAEFDKNPDVHNRPFQAFIHAISSNYAVGLHPSYRSNFDLSILKKEKEHFERLTHQTLILSRQHFLKLRFPETYHNLLALGVKKDYSMGYADDIGYRASIATPFRWFDLTKNEATELWIHPFQVMDVTLRDYLKLSPNEAIECVKILIKETQMVGGTFMTLWHNSSFSNTEGWESWREVYEKIALNDV
jgi:hypothetical protein